MCPMSHLAYMHNFVVNIYQWYIFMRMEGVLLYLPSTMLSNLSTKKSNVDCLTRREKRTYSSPPPYTTPLRPMTPYPRNARKQSTSAASLHRIHA